MSMQLGIDVLLQDEKLKKKLLGKRIAFLGHSASVTKDLKSSLEALKSYGLDICLILSPQHGLHAVKQANMITSQDGSEESVPVVSLYSEKRRRIEAEHLKSFDVLLVDLQDVGCRVYTYISTLFYLLEDLKGKSIWILDRPNPSGRSIEGLILDLKFQSFVGVAPIPIRHGMTLGELCHLV